MDIVTLGIDLAKNIFALHGVDQTGRAVLVKPRVRRDQLLELVASLPHRHGSLHRRAPLGEVV